MKHFSKHYSVCDFYALCACSINFQLLALVGQDLTNVQSHDHIRPFQGQELDKIQEKSQENISHKISELEENENNHSTSIKSLVWVVVPEF